MWIGYPEHIDSSEYTEYGLDELQAEESNDESNDEGSDMEGVPVPEIDSQYTRFNDILRNQVDPLAESDNLAIDIYERVVRVISAHDTS